MRAWAYSRQIAQSNTLHNVKPLIHASKVSNYKEMIHAIGSTLVESDTKDILMPDHSNCRGKLEIAYITNIAPWELDGVQTQTPYRWRARRCGRQ